MIRRIIIIELTLLLIAAALNAAPQEKSILQLLEKTTVQLDIASAMIKQQTNYINWQDDCLRVDS